MEPILRKMTGVILKDTTRIALAFLVYIDIFRREAINVFAATEIEVNVEGGVTDMCKAWNDMKESVAKEAAKEAEKQTTLKNLTSLFENGGSYELAIKMFKDLSEDLIRKVQEEVGATPLA